MTTSPYDLVGVWYQCDECNHRWEGLASLWGWSFELTPVETEAVCPRCHREGHILDHEDISYGGRQIGAPDLPPGLDEEL